MGNWRNHIRKKYMRHLDLLQRFPFKDNWMKELGSEVAGGSEDSQPKPTKIKNPIIKHGETCEELCASVC